MKNKNTTIVLVIVCAMLLLGIGYAAASSINLTVNGTATGAASDGDFDVAFDSSVEPTKTGGITTASISDDTTATIAATLNTTTDTGTATFTIKNSSSDLKASISCIVEGLDASESNYFSVSKTLASSELNAGASTTLQVTVSLIKTPVSDQNANFSVKCTAEPAE